ncbi:hypothetical protein AB4Y86_06995 [Arthrobacter sp. 2YAF22_2]|uniref:hypothetical protein n=1 Tax=Arthrobacter sp. 2YAF22_2 TaxID=3233029 RepID=UPI003F90EFEB
MDINNGSFGRRIVDLPAVAMIGDGALALVVPAEHMKTWICGPQRWRDLINFLAERPGLTRVVGAVEVCAALWWVRRSLNGSSHARDR